MWLLIFFGLVLVGAALIVIGRRAPARAPAVLPRNFRAEDALRRQQILTESIEIALASKNFGTIESRRKVIKDLHEEILEYDAAILSDDQLRAIGNLIELFEREVSLMQFLNPARDLYEKSFTFKTWPARKRRLDQARNLLLPARRDHPDNQDMSALLAAIDEALAKGK
jgi:hypothetical protein